jgi:hypothetical protein
MRVVNRIMRGSQPARAPVAGRGRFEKGHKKSGGRRKGVPNAMTRELREAILNAATKLGEDGKGRDGLEGYVMMLARKERKIFASLLRAVLPMQVTTSINTLVNVEYTSLEQATEEARRLGLPERRVFELMDYRRIKNVEDESPST